MKNQKTKARRATICTATMKLPAKTSATLWMGALFVWAASTSLIIWARAVSAPTFVALNLNDPVLLRVAPITVPPAPFSTGMLSPVIMDSSIAELPSTTTPSTGIFSPGRTTTISPTTTSSTGTSFSTPSTRILEVLALNPINFRMASEVLPRALASRYLPKTMKIIKKATVS